MQPPNFPNLAAIQPQPLPSDPAALRQGEKEDDWFAQDKRKQAHFREQRAKSVIHYMILGLIFLTGISLAGAIMVRTLHLILPQRLMWLTAAQIEVIDNIGKFAVTGALGAFLTRYLTRNAED
jgi:hypothetical protein